MNSRRDADMTTRTSSRISLAVAACIVLALYGAIIGNWMWGTKEAAAATQSPTIDMTALMSTVEVASLPMTQVADLF
jgi:hypothetical protein